MVQSFLVADSVGYESTTPCKSTLADQQALTFIGENVRHTGQRYEVGLTWKENVEWQINYQLAKAQFKLQSRSSKDETVQIKYQEKLCKQI